MINKLQILSVLLLTISFACQSPNEYKISPSSPDMSQPIATGIFITSSSPDPIGVWGNPADGSGALSAGYPSFDLNSGDAVDTFSILKQTNVAPVPPHGLPLNLFNPYPNPADAYGGCVINFSIPVTSYVELYVVPARWYGDVGNDINSSAGAITVAPKRTAIAILVRTVKAGGIYACQWSALDQKGNPLPSGFYRIYLHVGDTVIWHDVLLYDKITDLPMSLR